MDNLSKPQPQSSRSLWTLSYRIHGLVIALAIAAGYSYFHLHYWHKPLLIAAVIFGYFIGWLVGNFTYKKN